MKFLFDFGPIILFFVVYKFFGLYAAIYAMIASTFAQMMYARITTGKFVTSQVLTFILLIVFGGISIALRDPAFRYVESERSVCNICNCTDLLVTGLEVRRCSKE